MAVKLHPTCLACSDEPHTMDNRHLPDLPPGSVIFGKSSLMMELETKMRRVLGTNLPVLLQGESGTGRQTLSRFIHEHSKSVSGSYLKVNCVAESDIFRQSGLSTLVVDESRSDCTASASGLDLSSIGTLFLEDVAELSSKSQSHLFHSLPDEHDCGAGNQLNRWTKTRVISSTSSDLRREVNERRFRRDLFYRLAVVTLEVPPLRNRLDDLLIIADHLRQQYSQHFGLSVRPFPDKLVERMRHHNWPGNIRELENFVCRYVILGSEERVFRELGPGSETAPLRSAISASGTRLKDVTRRALANVEREMIMKALDQHQGNLKQAANSLGISYRTLINKMDQAGLPRTRHATRSGNK